MCISPTILNAVSRDISGVTASAGVGALAGALVSPIGVAGGALFGAISYCVETPLNSLLSQIDDPRNRCLRSAIKVIQFVLPFLAAVAASMFAASLLGLPIGLGSAVLLTFLTNPQRTLMGYALVVVCINFVKKVLFNTIIPCLFRPCMSAEAAQEARQLRAMEMPEAEAG